MSKYLYTTVYEEFTGLTPPEPTDNKQRRKRGYGHPYRMRLNYMQESVESKPKKPERRNQFGQSVANRKHREQVSPRAGSRRQGVLSASNGEGCSLPVAKEGQMAAYVAPDGNGHGWDERDYCRNFNGSRILSGHGAEISDPLTRTITQGRKDVDMPKVTYKKRRSITSDEQNDDF